MNESTPYHSHDLALFDGGPFARSLRWARLRGEELGELCWLRTVFLVGVTWLPLLLLSALDGQALGDLSGMPFLLDASAHVRFLLALPLLIVAEIGVNARIREALKQFDARQIVPPPSLPRFREAITAAIRSRDSWLAEAIMMVWVLSLAIVHYSGLYFALNEAPVGLSSWHELAVKDGGGRSSAGMWFNFISMPIFQFVTLRWYYRIMIWAVLLWRVSRLELHLVPTHPDRVAGLGFLSQTAYAYLPLALAHGAMLSAIIANRILYGDEVLTMFWIEITLMVMFVFCLVLLPLLLFAPLLTAAKLKGSAEYGALAGSVVRAFDERWLRDRTREKSNLLDVGEASSMTDLDTTLGIIREMSYVPIARETILWIAVAVLAPMLPLLLTVMPAEELLKKLLGMLL